MNSCDSDGTHPEVDECHMCGETYPYHELHKNGKRRPCELCRRERRLRYNANYKQRFSEMVESENTPETDVCDGCGKIVPFLEVHNNRGEKRVCNACKRDYNATPKIRHSRIDKYKTTKSIVKSPPDDVVTLTCDQCGIVFGRLKSNRDSNVKNGRNRNFFCSQECFRKYIKSEITMLTCTQCGVEFERLEHTHRANKKRLGENYNPFCSLECANQFKRGRKLSGKPRPNTYTNWKGDVLRVCSECNLEKPISDFPYARGICKLCVGERATQLQHRR